MTTQRILSVLAIIFIMLAGACKKDDSTPYVVYNYDGAASAGDVVSMAVNQSIGGYTVYNESNKRYANGSYVVYNGEMNGLYKVFVSGAFYYAVEIPGQVFTGNFPTARLYNTLSYSTSTDSRTTNPNMPGLYVYLRITNSQVNGSTLNKEWGLLDISAAGTWKRQSYCNDSGSIAKLMPEDYNGPVTLTSATDSGTWQAMPLYPNRLRMASINYPDSITGFSNALDSGAVFVMDLGYGNGFLVGMKLQDGNKNYIKGGYGYADSRYDGSTGGGKFSIADTSYIVQWWRGDSFGKVKSGSFGVLYPCPVLKNVYYARNVIFDRDTVDFYAVTSGPYFMEFQFSGNKFRSSGTGGRIK
jgi:hypothetical protein